MRIPKVRKFNKKKGGSLGGDSATPSSSSSTPGSSSNHKKGFFNNVTNMVKKKGKYDDDDSYCHADDLGLLDASSSHHVTTSSDPFALGDNSNNDPSQNAAFDMSTQELEEEYAWDELRRSNKHIADEDEVDKMNNASTTSFQADWGETAPTTNDAGAGESSSKPEIFSSSGSIWARESITGDYSDDALNYKPGKLSGVKEPSGKLSDVKEPSASSLAVDDDSGSPNNFKSGSLRAPSGVFDDSEGGILKNFKSGGLREPSGVFDGESEDEDRVHLGRKASQESAVIRESQEEDDTSSSQDHSLNDEKAGYGEERGHNTGLPGSGNRYKKYDASLNNDPDDNISLSELVQESQIDNEDKRDDSKECYNSELEEDDSDNESDYDDDENDEPDRNNISLSFTSTEGDDSDDSYDNKNDDSNDDDDDDDDNPAATTPDRSGRKNKKKRPNSRRKSVEKRISDDPFTQYVSTPSSPIEHIELDIENVRKSLESKSKHEQ